MVRLVEVHRYAPKLHPSGKHSVCMGTSQYCTKGKEDISPNEGLPLRCPMKDIHNAIISIGNSVVYSILSRSIQNYFIFPDLKELESAKLAPISLKGKWFS